eukprot:2514172-Lingulodinium_polyedra.AAC.1
MERRLASRQRRAARRAAVAAQVGAPDPLQALQAQLDALRGAVGFHVGTPAGAGPFAAAWSCR